ncbi:hypothetical protein [Actinoalloteichus spitiensis]|uniref:hypothetical protein n=1 Tax=Actinoalloteichus spitiensis TaxID=252394 RepID=UPI0012F66331|nr:hypothetical protein [Actinoalloteichus spitiensis]
MSAPQSAARPRAARPALTFPVGDDRCRQYRIVCGYYECVHGHVLKVGHPRRGGRR